LTIALPARAKLNLDLSVLGRRDDGYHDVRTTLQAIDLHDLITLTPVGRAQGESKSDTTTLTTSGLKVGSTQNNSVLKALAALEKATNQHLPTQIHLHKRIPPGAGMGGASSDAAAALRGLAALHHVTADLPAIARQLGSDVPFFLVGGSAIAEQRGDHLTPIPTRPSWFAIAWPEVELLTKDVYRAWDEADMQTRAHPHPLREGGGDMPNHLTKAAMHVEPRLEAFAASLGRDWQMTGSGSAFFRCCTDQRAATECTDALKSLKCWTAVAQAVGAWN
jgi:4-diphosphocytidyl-2-C-methyl-D-erythritol kinase